MDFLLAPPLTIFNYKISVSGSDCPHTADILTSRSSATEVIPFSSSAFAYLQSLDLFRV